MFHLPFFGGRGSKQLPFKKIKFVEIAACCRAAAGRAGSEPRAGTRARVRTDVTDGRGQTDGKHSNTHTHGAVGAEGKVLGTPRQHLRVCAALQVRSPASRSRCTPAGTPQQRGHTHHSERAGGRGKVKPARGRGGTLVPTLFIERDSCLHHQTTAKETALGENNNNKSSNPQNNKYLQHLLPRANVWQELGGLQDSQTVGQRVSKLSGRRSPFHSTGKGTEVSVQSWSKSGASRCAHSVSKELKVGSGLSGGEADASSCVWRFTTFVIQRGVPDR